MEGQIKTNISTKNIRNKTVVVTGASSGAGRATAIELAKHGAKIVLAGRNMEALDDLESHCRDMGSLAIAVRTDVTDAKQLQELASIAFEFGGSIDVWVNNAGVLAAGEFDKTPIEIHEQVIKVNLLGYINGAHAVLPYFKQQGKGILINNISVGGWFAVPYGVGYSASKYGLRGYSEALRGELIDYPGIHVCDLFPAFLDTPGIQHAANYTGYALKPAPPVYSPLKVAKAIVSLIERPRSSVTIGSVAILLKMANSLFPVISRSVTAKMIKAYFKVAYKAPETSGNLFSPAKYGTSIYGGWNSDADYEVRKNTALKTAAITGIAAGLFLLGRYQLSKKSKQ